MVQMVGYLKFKKEVACSIPTKLKKIWKSGNKYLYIKYSDYINEWLGGPSGWVFEV